MRQLVLLLFSVAIVLGLGVLALVATIAPTMAETVSEMDTAPVSAVDLVFESRQTPVIAPEASGGGWVTVLAVLLVLVVVGAVLFAISRGGGELIRQWRLTFKKKQSRYPAPYNVVPHMAQLTPQEVQLLTNARQAQQVPQMEVNHDQQVNHSNHH